MFWFSKLYILEYTIKFMIQQPAQDDDIVIQDVEGYRSDNLMFFSFDKLAMDSLRRASESKAHEMRPGATNTKLDLQGNTVITYIEDTRKKFIESVKAAKMIWIAEFDKECEENVEKIKKHIENERKRLIKAQMEWWNNQTPKMKQILYFKGRAIITPGTFNSELPWYQEFIETEVEAYQEMCEEIVRLAKRLNYLKEEDFEA